jgi:hypothetical protein
MFLTRENILTNIDLKETKKARSFLAEIVVFVAILVASYFIFFQGDDNRITREGISKFNNSTLEQVQVDPNTPGFDVVRISKYGSGVIAGFAIPNSLVEFYVNDQQVDDVRADHNGDWVMILEEPLTPGSAELSLVAISPTGERYASRDIVIISIPERAILEENEPDVNGVMAVLTPRDGAGPSRILQLPGSDLVGDIGDSLNLDSLDYNEIGHALISGRALPRAHVVVYLDNEFIGSVKADDEGRWTIAPQTIVSQGAHVLRIDQIIGDGEVELRIEQPFETGFPIDMSKRTGRVMVQPGNSLWHIARRIYGSGVRYSLIFQENAEQIANPDLIYPGQLFDLPGFGDVVDEQGQD